jgi:hypothetical protein
VMATSEPAAAEGVVDGSVVLPAEGLSEVVVVVDVGMVEVGGVDVGMADLGMAHVGMVDLGTAFETGADPGRALVATDL